MGCYYLSLPLIPNSGTQVLNSQLVYMVHLPIVFMVAALTLQQPYDCPSASQTILKIIVKSTATKLQTPFATIVSIPSRKWTKFSMYITSQKHCNGNPSPADVLRVNQLLVITHFYNNGLWVVSQYWLQQLWRRSFWIFCASWQIRLTKYHGFNSLAPRRFGSNFEIIIFKLIMQNSSFSTRCEITPRGIPQS